MINRRNVNILNNPEGRWGPPSGTVGRRIIRKRPTAKLDSGVLGTLLNL